jgi:hypothetical protein
MKYLLIHQHAKTTSNTWKKEVDTSHPSIDSTIISGEWTQVSSKNHRKGVINSDKGATKISEQLNKTHNRFSPLTNLCDQQDGLSNYRNDNFNFNLFNIP